MNVKSPTHTTLTRLIPPLTIWAIGKILETPSVKGSVMELDGIAYKKRHERDEVDQTQRQEREVEFVLARCRRGGDRRRHRPDDEGHAEVTATA